VSFATLEDKYTAIDWRLQNCINMADVCAELWSMQSTLRTSTCQQFEQFEFLDLFVPLTAFPVSTAVSCKCC